MNSDFQSSEWDVEVSEHVERSGERVAGPPQAACGETVVAKLASCYLRPCLGFKRPVSTVLTFSPLSLFFHCQSEANNTAMLGKLMSIASKNETIHFSPRVFFLFFNSCLVLSENLPDAGKAQDFMKKFNQVLGEDEKLRLQLEMLISPTCSCKQAETCVVSTLQTHR